MKVFEGRVISRVYCSMLSPVLIKINSGPAGSWKLEKLIFSRCFPLWGQRKHFNWPHRRRCPPLPWRDQAWYHFWTSIKHSCFPQTLPDGVCCPISEDALQHSLVSLAVGCFVKIEFDCFVFISNPNIIRNSRITHSYILEHLQSFVIFAGKGASTELFDIGAIEGDYCKPRCGGCEGLQQCHVGRCSEVILRSKEEQRFSWIEC